MTRKADRDTEAGTYDETVEMLKDALPNGSGINGDWTFGQHWDSSRFTCYNSFEAKDEGGGHCHDWDFNVTVDVKSDKLEFVHFSFQGQRELACCGSGLRDYLENYLWESLELYMMPDTLKA